LQGELLCRVDGGTCQSLPDFIERLAYLAQPQNADAIFAIRQMGLLRGIQRTAAS
jgi:hypothetical protein